MIEDMRKNNLFYNINQKKIVNIVRTYLEFQKNGLENG
jgi:hypothetical protein